jgi:putative cell wall-binding protein
LKRFSKSAFGAGVAGALAVSGFAFVAGSVGPAAAAATSASIAGANRYGTAAAVAAAAFPTGTVNGIAVLASGENFPDGLAAAGLAGDVGGPVLLTPAASLAPETINALGSLHVNTVDVVGGAAAVSANVISQLKGFGYNVNVYSGADRYATAAAVAAQMATILPIGSFNGIPTAFLATGLNFPDALSAGSPAYAAHLPILLTDTNTLSTSASSALTSLGIKQVIVMGGDAAVSPSVVSSVKALGVNVIQEAGATRFATAADLANLEFATSAPTFGYQTNPAFSGNAILVSGLNFPDALSAAPLAGRGFSPILLNDAFPPESGAFLTAHASLFTKVTGIGGVVGSADLASAVAAINGTAVTGTVNAIQGATGFTVTYSGAVNSSTASLISNYLVNNATLGGALGGAVSFNAASNTAVITGLVNPLKIGDVITVSSNVTAPTGTVSVTPFTVGADTSTPTVSAVYAYPGQTVFAIKYNKPTILTGGGANAGDNPANIHITSATAGAVSLVPVAVGGPTHNPSLDPTGTSVEFNVAGTLSAGDVITVSPGPAPAATIKDAAGNSMAPYSFTVISTTVAPSIVSATHSVTNNAAATNTYGGLTITAQVNGAAGGAYGNNYAFLTAQAACGGSVTTPTVVAADPGGPTPATATTPAITNLDITFGCTGGAHETAQNAAVDLNANTSTFNGVPFNQLFTASGPAVAGTAAPLAALAGGTSTITEVLVFSQPIMPTWASLATFTSNQSGASLATQQSVSGFSAATQVDSNVIPTIFATQFGGIANSYKLPSITGGSTISLATAPPNYAGIVASTTTVNG